MRKQEYREMKPFTKEAKAGVRCGIPPAPGQTLSVLRWTAEGGAGLGASCALPAPCRPFSAFTHPISLAHSVPSPLLVFQVGAATGEGKVHSYQHVTYWPSSLRGGQGSLELPSSQLSNVVSILHYQLLRMFPLEKIN